MTAPVGASSGVRSGYSDALFQAKIVSDGECQLYTGARDRQGYGHVLRKAVRKSPLQAHRYAWMLENGPIPDGAVVRHTCDRPSCVNIDHLEIGTQADNIRDRQERGRHRPGRLTGEDHPAAKLTVEDVIYIRSRYVKYGREPLARYFGVSKNTIYRVATRRTWAEVA